MIGTGILKGMAVTARNFVGSYFEKERLITVQYPEERIPLPENYRNFPILIYDNDPEAGLRCVACKICEKECPPQCIYITKSDDKNLAEAAAAAQAKKKAAAAAAAAKPTPVTPNPTTTSAPGSTSVPGATPPESSSSSTKS